MGYNETKHSFYTKASFLRVQDVNLSYQFPKSAIQKIGIEELTTYINARNLYTFSGAKKFTTNLEQDKYSLDSPDIIVKVGDTPRSSYPNQRVFIIGVNVTF